MGWEIDKLVKARVGLVTLGMSPVTDITFNCAAIHFPTVYNLRHHQRPFPFIPYLYGVGG